MCSRHIPVCLAVTLLLAASLHGQPPAFDVASIRPSRAEGTSFFRAMPNGQFIARNVELRSLILRAFRLHESQLLGGPAWIGAERFDVEARVDPPPAAGPGALMPMLRALLAERFQLRTHEETREMPAYALVHARRDGRLGAQIEPSQLDCSRGGVNQPGDSRPALRDGWPPCGGTGVTSAVDASGRSTWLRARHSALSMPEFASLLQGVLQRPVVDRTGLGGSFDLEYTYQPEPPGLLGIVPADGGELPSRFVAMEEQLGLKVQSERVGIPVIVIDAVERPSEN
jgi:uncharacterized protein (TIGR03435 family)